MGAHCGSVRKPSEGDLTVMECHSSSLLEILVINFLDLSAFTDHQLAFSVQTLLFDVILGLLANFIS